MRKLAREYRNYRKNATQIFVITEHRLECSYNFDWDNVEILNKEVHLNKHSLSKMIHKKGLICKDSSNFYFLNQDYNKDS